MFPMNKPALTGLAEHARDQGDLLEMSTTVTQSFRRNSGDHFEPEEVSDPHVQRALRGTLEQIDYTAYTANREVLAKAVGAVNVQDFRSLGLAAAKARGLWVAAAVAVSKGGNLPDPKQVGQLTEMRQAYEELTEAYEAMRRMISRGYVTYVAT
jgi:hypothetical protein